MYFALDARLRRHDDGGCSTGLPDAEYLVLLFETSAFKAALLKWLDVDLLEIAIEIGIGIEALIYFDFDTDSDPDFDMRD